MSALLQDNLAAISKELETIKFACSDLDNRVEKLERENASLRETVTSLKGTVELRERTQRTADILVGESATPVRQDPALAHLGAPSDLQEVVRHIVCSEKEVEARQHTLWRT